ncbi:uncharacterized protein LOC124165134 [Ischnura elegans]|uniref:uncharacterized protein LOC124165134 n=1 Tax=Ischnura elegans TaxID=197161 RepID=UPI001ED86756|nr:uncharacterized protein LOC124165134 [Ischnura elegans]XP_046398396.1 uncharacterized protein LOC124165134 [Ischnura elegans]
MDTEDWQLSKVGVSERIRHLHKTKQWTDCTFQVSGESCTQIFQAHKVLLACCSPVFEAMLFGPIAEKHVIQVPDVEPEAFRILLEYIYTDRTSFPSLEATCATLYAAKKYLLPHLRQSCVVHLVDLLRPSNACSLYDFASALEEKELAQESLKVMCTYLQELLQDPSFVHISRGTLEAILREDLLNADGGEASLIAASMSWARQECKRCGLDPEDGCDLRRALGPEIMSHLRFMALGCDELEQHVQPRGVLTKDEVDALLKARCAVKKTADVGTGMHQETDLEVPSSLCTKFKPRSSIPISLRCCSRRYLKAGPLIGYRESPPTERLLGGYRPELSSGPNALNGVPPHSTVTLLCQLRCVTHSVVLAGIQVWTGLAPLSAFSSVTRGGVDGGRWVARDSEDACHHNPSSSSVDESGRHPHPRSPLTYEEEMEVAVLDLEGRVLCKVPFCEQVEYNSLATISLGEPVRLARGQDYRIRLQLCQPLQYPVAYLSVSETVNGVTFEFADYADPRWSSGGGTGRLVCRLDMGFVQSILFCPRE